MPFLCVSLAGTLLYGNDTASKRQIKVVETSNEDAAVCSSAVVTRTCNWQLELRGKVELFASHLEVELT